MKQTDLHDHSAEGIRLCNTSAILQKKKQLVILETMVYRSIVNEDLSLYLYGSNCDILAFGGCG